MAASLELAIIAIRSGRKEEGRQLLNLLIQQNPNNEHAWLWMSSVVDTDEQRARCLYHVLAINPENEVARKGLKILGIVVTDSRPVKIPRDSQPIKIPKPTSQSQTAYPQASQLDSKPVPVQAERRPFRINPQTIVEDLPFTPVRQPVAGSAQDAQPTDHSDQPRSPSNPVPLTAETSQPHLTNPSEPVPVVQANIPPDGMAPHSPQPAMEEPFYETRPSQPVPVTHSNPTQGMSQPVPQMGLANPYHYPAAHSNVTMGMPAHQHYQNQNPSQPMPGAQSNTTMGMAQSPGQSYGQPQHPSEPVPAVHSNGTMPMPAYYSQPQFPTMSQQNPAIYSNATMAMPMGYDPFAALSGAAQSRQDYPGMNSPRPGTKGKKQIEDEEEGEVNILAVIIFGSLSVTALGGLGMLILLMFTTG